jgi:hypothetical protein
MPACSGWCLRRVLERRPHADGIAVIFHFCGKRVKNIDLRPSSSIMRGCAAHPRTPLFLFLLVQIVRKKRHYVKRTYILEWVGYMYQTIKLLYKGKCLYVWISKRCIAFRWLCRRRTQQIYIFFFVS